MPQLLQHQCTVGNGLFLMSVAPVQTEGCQQPTEELTGDHPRGVEVVRLSAQHACSSNHATSEDG
jgi:hypothetical protein